MLVSSVQQSEWVTVLIVFSGSVMPNTYETPWTIACQAPLHGVFQARILAWVVISSCRGSSWPRDQIHVSSVPYIDRQILNHWAVWKSPESVVHIHISSFFLDSFPIYAITEYWIEFPVLYSKSLLVIYFICTTVYMSIPISQLSLTLPVWDLNNQPIRWILMLAFDGNIPQSFF